MTICNFCDREIKKTDSCLQWSAKFEGGLQLFGIPFYSKDPEETCPDCGIPVGGFHHPGCDQEVCPRCGSQYASCDCRVL